MIDWRIVEFFVNVSSAVIYPLLTVSLLIALRQIKKRRQNLQRKENEPADNTTKLILFMTIIFTFSEGLSGFSAFFIYHIETIAIHYPDLMLVK